MSSVTQYFWNNGSLTYADNDTHLIYYFSSWFVTKNALRGTINTIFSLGLTKPAIEAMFAVVQAKSVCLMLSSANPSTQRLVSMCKCKLYLINF
jgi:alpha-D-ribose 1-methylphosphonate 5-triphosphate synthase subunit PhnH